MSGSTPAARFDESRVDAIFARLDQCHLPGAAVGIALHGRPVYRKGFGLASMELPVPLTPATRLRIASETKHFTALTCLLLCEDGKASADDPIGRFLPELNAVSRGVTLRQLMGHVGGLHDAHDICWQFSGRNNRVSSEELLALYRDIDSVNVEPGRTWLYSNGGYLLLTAAIERITGQSLEQVLRERVFAPVGMHDSLLRRFDDDFVPNSATLHRAKADAAFESTRVRIDAPGAGFEKARASTAWAGEGGMVSTVDDMLRWLAHMDRPCIGSARTWQAMLAPLTLANGMSTGYSLGLMRGRYRGVETIHHAGGVTGGNAHMLKVPAVGLDVVVMANRDDVIGVLLVNEVLDACVTGLAPVAQAPVRPAVEGTFRSRHRPRVIQLYAKGEQQMASLNGLDLPVEADESGVFWPAGIFSYLRQSIAPRGADPERPAAIEFSDFGNVDSLERVTPADPAERACISGRYRAATIATDATIEEGSEHPVLTTFGRFGTARFRLDALGKRVWRARSMDLAMSWTGGVLRFAEDGAHFEFSASRTWAISFKRGG